MLRAHPCVCVLSCGDAAAVSMYPVLCICVAA